MCDSQSRTELGFLLYAGRNDKLFSNIIVALLAENWFRERLKEQLKEADKTLKTEALGYLRQCFSAENELAYFFASR